MIELLFHLSFGDFELEVETALPGSGVIALFGPSGSGKTSLLRCIAGLEKAKTGRLIVNGEQWQTVDRFVLTHQRAVGYVFQESSLFPHLNVRKNLEYAERRAKKVAPIISRDQAVSMLDIEHLLDRQPQELSGGERQRVAIARTLLTAPKLLLMDEPLASLDDSRKKEVIPYLKQLRSALNIPIIYVSHAADEVAQLADHLVVMDQGRITAAGPLTEMLTRLDFPISLGDDAGAVLEVEVVAKEPEWQMERAMFSGGELWLRDSGTPIGTEHRVRILARDVSLARARHQDTSIQNILPVRIETMIEDQASGTAMLRLNAGGHMLLARITLRSLARLELKPGELVWAQIKSVALLQ